MRAIAVASLLASPAAVDWLALADTNAAVGDDAKPSTATTEIPADARCPAGIPMPDHGPAPTPPRSTHNVSVQAKWNAADALPAMAAPFRGIGVNMDFWPPSKNKWTVSKVGGCGSLDLDLDQPDLRYLASQLAGSLLRLGGSPVDMLLYETPETPDACSDAELNKTQPKGGYYCPNWDQVDFRKSKGAHCLKSRRWEEINAFAQSSGLSIAFGLNACWLRPNAAGELDWTYVHAMLNQTAKLAARNASAVWAWEFGNELYNSGVHADRYGSDMAELMKRSDAAWDQAERSAGLAQGVLMRPRFVGPDDGAGVMSSAYAQQLLTAAKGAVHALTFHQYHNRCVAPEEGLALNVTCADEMVASARSLYAAATSSNDAELWLGEGALHSNSGARGVTDAFRSSLWYAQVLGALFTSNVKLFARQTLIGGDYELVNRTTAAPSPDYYVLLLWRRLVGDRPIRLNATGLDAAPGLRLYAFRAISGGQVLVAVNAHALLGVELQLPSGADVYQLSADPASNRVHFNSAFGGSELVYKAGGGGLPALQPVAVHGPELFLPPCSVTFVHTLELAIV